MKRFYLKQINIVLRKISEDVLCPQSAQFWQHTILQQAKALADRLKDQMTVRLTNPTEVSFYTEGILCLTDCPDTARRLVINGAPVIAWLHEGNRNCVFTDIRYAVETPQELDADFFDKIYRRYAGIAWEIAETERCIIRETTAEDVDSFVKIYRDPEITRYIDVFCMEPQKEREYVKEYVQKIYEFWGFGVWTVLWKETGEIIGRVGFEQPYAGGGEATVREGLNEKEEGLLSMGYMIASPWQGKGIAQEVCLAALDFARKELEVSKVQVVINAQNQPSLRLAERLGFGEWEEMTASGVMCRKGILTLPEKHLA